MAKRDCYDVLGIPKGASKDDIKKAILLTINWIWKNRRGEIDNGFVQYQGRA